MSTTVTFNGQTYIIPAISDASWGTAVNSYLTALASGSIQLSGGSYTLASPITLAAYGIIAPYFKTNQASPASQGLLRLSSADTIVWNTLSGEMPLGVNASGQLIFNGQPVGGSGGTILLGPYSQVTPPPNPPMGTDYLYFKADDNLYRSTHSTGEALIATGGIQPATWGGTGVANSAANTITFSSALYGITFTLTGATTVTFPTSGTLATTSQLISTPVSPTLGGTGVANDATNLLTFSGHYPLTLTLSAGTSLTLPTTGTLATTSQIPTIPVSAGNGGTGVAQASNLSTITLAGPIASAATGITVVGAYGFTATLTAQTAVTFPITGTLATTTNTEALSNKTLGSTNTLTGALMASFTPDGTHTLTAPASTGTLALTSQIPSLPVSGANGGTGVANTGSTITFGGNITFSGAYGFTATLSNTTAVTFPTSGTLATTSQLPGGSNLVPANYGGTGVANTATITIGGAVSTGGAFTLSGAYGFTGTLTNTTAVTFPVSGTLATTAQLPGGSNLVPATYGGTGVGNNVANTITFSGAYGLTITLSNTTSITLPTSGTLATLSGTETWTNKSLSDTTTKIINAADATKVVAFDVSGMTTGKTQTYAAISDANNILSFNTTGVAAGKKLGFVAANTSADAFFTLPAATDTLAGLGASQTLLLKTLTSPAINGGITNFGTAGAANRLIVPSNTAANIAGLTATAANLAFATDTNQLYVGTGAAMVAVGGGLTNDVQTASFTAVKNYHHDVLLSSADITASIPSVSAGGTIEFSTRGNNTTTKNFILSTSDTMTYHDVAYTQLTLLPRCGWVKLTADVTNSTWIVDDQATFVAGTFAGSCEFTGSVKADVGVKVGATYGIDYSANTPAAGATSVSQIVEWGESGTFTVSATGAFTATQTVTFTYARVGKVVVLSTPTLIAAASHADTINIAASQFPAVLRPAVSAAVPIQPHDGAGYPVSMGRFVINADGSGTGSLLGGSYAASGTAGWLSFNMVYTIN